MKNNEVNVYFTDEEYEKIKATISYRNIRATIDPNTDDFTNDWTIVDFIRGCVIYYLDELDKSAKLSGYGTLGKPFKIKNRFKEFIEESGMKQKELSEMTGIHRGNISTMLSNQKQPSLDYFLRVWVALGCPPIHEVLYREED